jgi:2-hydroxychromene-2-carboxylate isomerase
MDRPLTVYIDFKSPYAYLAIQPTRHLAEEIGIQINWLPFVLDIPSYLGSARLDKSGQVTTQSRSEEQWSWVKYAYYDCRRYANLRSMTIRGTVKIWDTNLAAMGMLWARRQGDEILQRYIDGIYVPFWKRELDVEDVSVVEAVLGDAGAVVSGFKTFARGEGVEKNQLLQQKTFGQGIFGVPTYVLGDDIYFGREHLPRIRWQLEGERGPSPDIGYELLPGDVVERATTRNLDVGIRMEELASNLAIPHVLSMAEDLDLAVTWYALPRKEPGDRHDSGDQSRGARHRRSRSESRECDQRRYLPPGLASGEIAPATAALLERNDISLQESGFPGAWVGAGNLRSPVFSIGEETFIGRQHLPLIKARFSSTQPPAAANSS